jgi:RNA-directed DNA polymerase
MTFARHEWAFHHEQTPLTTIIWSRNRFKPRQRPRRTVTSVGMPTVAQIAATDNLIAAFYEMKRSAGQAPGPDGVTYRHLSGREVADCSRALSRVVLEGSYVPGSSRAVRVPKTKGGHRTLRLSNLFDRVLSSALNRAMEPLWESIYLPMSFGFRPGRGVWHLLAELESIVIREDRWVLAIDDLRKAFDNLIIADILRDHEKYIKDTALLSLISVVLRGSAGEKGLWGIAQGCPYSPTALNVRLHHAYDLEAEQGHFPPRFRYADNLVAACRDEAEGQRFLNGSRQLLMKAGLDLKQEDELADLARGDTTQLLGFTLSRKEDRLVFGLGLKPG